MVTLTPLENLQGALTLAFVLISLFLGLIIISKYFKYKKIDLILVGLSWIFLMSVYWPDAINFVMISTTGKQLEPRIYFFLANAFITLIYFTWLKVFSNFVLKKRQREFALGMILIAVVFEAVFLTIFFLDYTMIGTQKGPFYVEWALFIDVYLLFSVVVFTVTGILFAMESLRSQNKEVRLKGKFLIIAFIAFATGTTIDVAFDLTEVTLVLARVFVIIAAFAFYIGFTLPRFIVSIFLGKTPEEVKKEN